MATKFPKETPNTESEEYEEITEDPISIESLLEDFQFQSKISNFQETICTKSEFAKYKYKKGEPEKNPGTSLYKHQEFNRDFLTHFPKQIHLHEPGTGKSHGIAPLVEYFRIYEVYGRTSDRGIVIVKNNLLRLNLRKEIFGTIVTKRDIKGNQVNRERKYPHEIYKGKSESEFKKLEKFFEITTYGKITRKIMELSDTELREKYSNSIIIADELHSIVPRKFVNYEKLPGQIVEQDLQHQDQWNEDVDEDVSGEDEEFDEEGEEYEEEKDEKGKKGRGKKVIKSSIKAKKLEKIKQMYRLTHIPDKLKVIGMSATIVFNYLAEAPILFRVILPTSTNLPFDVRSMGDSDLLKEIFRISEKKELRFADYEDITVEDLRKHLDGYIFYIKAPFNHVVERAIQYDPLKTKQLNLEDKQERVDKALETRTFNGVLLSEYQIRAYKQIEEQKEEEERNKIKKPSKKDGKSPKKDKGVAKGNKGKLENQNTEVKLHSDTDATADVSGATSSFGQKEKYIMRATLPPLLGSLDYIFDRTSMLKYIIPVIPKRSEEGENYWIFDNKKFKDHEIKGKIKNPNLLIKSFNHHSDEEQDKFLIEQFNESYFRYSFVSKEVKDFLVPFFSTITGLSMISRTYSKTIGDIINNEGMFLVFDEMVSGSGLNLLTFCLLFFNDYDRNGKLCNFAFYDGNKRLETKQTRNGIVKKPLSSENYIPFMYNNERNIYNFTMFTSETKENVDIVNNILDLCNQPDNVEGQQNKVFLYSAKAREGISINNGRYYYQIGTTYDPSMDYQAKKRGNRIKSHNLILKNMRTNLEEFPVTEPYGKIVSTKPKYFQKTKKATAVVESDLEDTPYIDVIKSLNMFKNDDYLKTLTGAKAKLNPEKIKDYAVFLFQTMNFARYFHDNDEEKIFAILLDKRTDIHNDYVNKLTNNFKNKLGMFRNVVINMHVIEEFREVNLKENRSEEQIKNLKDIYVNSLKTKVTEKQVKEYQVKIRSYFGTDLADVDIGFLAKMYEEKLKSDLSAGKIPKSILKKYVSYSAISDLGLGEYCEPLHSVVSYNLIKDISIKDFMRKLKKISADCGLNMERNYRTALRCQNNNCKTYQIDTDYSQDCDYDECEYECDYTGDCSKFGDLSTELTVDSRDIEIRLFEILKNYFRMYGRGTVGNIIEIMRDDFEKYKITSVYEPKIHQFIFTTIYDIQKKSVLLLDRFGMPCKVANEGDVFYLEKSFDLKSSDSGMSYYSNCYEFLLPQTVYEKSLKVGSEKGVGIAKDVEKFITEKSEGNDDIQDVFREFESKYELYANALVFLIPDLVFPKKEGKFKCVKKNENDIVDYGVSQEHSIIVHVLNLNFSNKNQAGGKHWDLNPYLTAGTLIRIFRNSEWTSNEGEYENCFKQHLSEHIEKAYQSKKKVFKPNKYTGKAHQSKNKDDDPKRYIVGFVFETEANGKGDKPTKEVFIKENINTKKPRGKGIKLNPKDAQARAIIREIGVKYFITEKSVSAIDEKERNQSSKETKRKAKLTDKIEKWNNEFGMPLAGESLTIKKDEFVKFWSDNREDCPEKKWTHAGESKTYSSLGELMVDTVFYVSFALYKYLKRNDNIFTVPKIT